jgi:hypothetical protein
MPTNTAGTTARQLPFQAIHYLRKNITFADNGRTVTVGTIPSGALVIPGISGLAVRVAFNGDTTNTSDIGITGTTTKYASALALGTLGWIELDTITEASASNLVVSADETIIATVISTASATTGSADIIIAYIPNNDQ